MKSSQIIFLGYVGVGKSTQISLLYEYFRINRVSVCKRYLKSFYPSMLGFIARLAHETQDERLDGSVLVALSESVTKRLMKGILLIDILTIVATYLLTIKIPSIFNRVILVEEGLLGTIVEYMDAVWTDLVDERFASKLVKFLLLFIQRDKPLVVILLTQTTMLEKRWIKRKSPFETGVYLKSQYRCIKLFAALFKERIILVEDEGRGIMEVHKAIVDRLCNYGHNIKVAVR